MKFLNLATLIVLFSLNYLYAQNTQKLKIYRTWVTLKSEPFKIEGVLYAIKDSSLLLSNAYRVKNYHENNFSTEELHINNIQTAKVRRSFQAGRVALIGALTGFTIGFLVGNSPGFPCLSPNECPEPGLETGIYTGFLFGSVGAGLGALLGSVKIKIPINGNIDNYYRNYNVLKKYAIKNN